MRIAVVGSGYVGLVSAACLAEIGHEVISVDADLQKIAPSSVVKCPSMSASCRNYWNGTAASG